MPDVVLPALNEAEALPIVLAAMPDGYRAIVVDNGSTDDTAAVAAAYGALVIHESQMGFGAACWAGLQASTDDIICFMDADASFDPRDLPSLVVEIEQGGANLVMGSRVPKPGSWPLHARVANRVLAKLIARKSGVVLQDLGPMRALRREELLALGMKDRRSGWPLEMVLRGAAAGWTIIERPVEYAPRVGSSKVTGTVRGTSRAVKDMSRLLATFDERESVAAND